MGIEADIAKLLLEIQSVSLNVSQPFQYTSGILSPIYCDNRLLISYPQQRTIVCDAFLQMIEDKKLTFDVIAGTATAGIPHAAWIANRLKKPMVYVRAQAKKHGLQNQIEGKIFKGSTALVIEDLISTGQSAINAALALRDAGFIVNDCLAIFTYQLKLTIQKFQSAHLNLFTLSNFNQLLDIATKLGYIDEQERKIAAQWNANPTEWKNQ